MQCRQAAVRWRGGTCCRAEPQPHRQRLGKREWVGAWEGGKAVRRRRANNYDNAACRCPTDKSAHSAGTGRTTAECQATCSSAEPGRSVWRPSVKDREDGAAFQGHFQGKRSRRLPARPAGWPPHERTRKTRRRLTRRAIPRTRTGPGRQIRLSNHLPLQSKVEYSG